MSRRSGHGARGSRPLRRVLALLVVLACSSALCLSLSGCFGMGKPVTSAATVNGAGIAEDDVTEYIEGFRSKRENLETDSGWAAYLSSLGKTAESMRQYVIETVFVPRLLIRQQCALRDIGVTDEQLDSVVEAERQHYEQRYGADSWASVLDSYGYDEESWRSNEEDRLLEEALMDQVAERVEPTAEQVQHTADEKAAVYNGKHSYRLSFASEEEALRAREDMLRRSGSSMTPKRFKRYGDAVNAGWNSLPGDKDEMSATYIAELNKLDEGDVGEPFEEDGSYVLVYCDKVFTVSKSGQSVDLSAVPKPIRRQLVQDAADALQSSAFEEWLDGMRRAADIVVNSMPDLLPYNANVDVDDDF